MVAQIKTAQIVSKVGNVGLPVAPSRGTVQVFTSPQRGFYVDVVAQALRLAGQGTPTLLVQFLQGGINQGVNHPRQMGQNLVWLRGDLSRNLDLAVTELTESERQAILELWEYTKTAIATAKYQLIVLDELHLVAQAQVISESEILEIISSRPQQVDLILTGANIPSSLIESADQVTQRRN